jgi:hypothetical protein
MPVLIVYTTTMTFNHNKMVYNAIEHDDFCSLPALLYKFSYTTGGSIIPSNKLDVLSFFAPFPILLYRVPYYTGILHNWSN